MHKYALYELINGSLVPKLDDDIKIEHQMKRRMYNFVLFKLIEKKL